MAIKKIPTPVRLPDWQNRLFALIEQHRNTPFAWGEHDCITWGAKCVYAVNGTTIENNNIPRKTPKTAAKIIKALGGVNKIITKELGEPLATPLLAMRGDIVVFSRDDASAVGVCVGADAVCVDIDGLKNIPMTKAEKAWRV